MVAQTPNVHKPRVALLPRTPTQWEQICQLVADLLGIPVEAVDADTVFDVGSGCAFEGACCTCWPSPYGTRDRLAAVERVRAALDAMDEQQTEGDE